MDTTYTDIREGERLHIVVEFISRRAVDCGEKRVERLLVADRTGRRFRVLTTPDGDAFAGLKVGQTYRFSGLLGAAPADTAADTTAECSACEGPLRPGCAVDTVDAAVGQAASQLDLEEPFGILDAEASVRPDSESVASVDDWIPVDSAVTPPEAVCVSCGRQVDDRNRGGHEADCISGTRAAEISSPASVGGDTANLSTVDLVAGELNPSPRECTGWTTTARANIAHGYTPQPAAISDGALFHDCRFEPGGRNGSETLFTPRYGIAVSEHPITGETERHLLVEMDLTRPVERPRLDLVVVLDISGSMDGPVDAYYYDRRRTAEDVPTNREADEVARTREADEVARTREADDVPTKLEVATRALCTLTERLHEDDRLGVVLHDARTHVAKPLRSVDATDLPAIRRHVRDIEAGGGTNLADGFEAAVGMLAGDARHRQRERRVICVTDLMPNTGTTRADKLTDLFADAATSGIHTTVLGVGVDANATLTETLSDVRGANHHSVYSARAFERRLARVFDAMVSPLGYDLTIELDAEGYEIGAVHGALSADATTDRLVHAGTLFPPARPDGRPRGGMVLVELEQTGRRADLDVTVSWLEREGGEYTDSVTVEMPDDPGTYTHQGVRKAIALARYTRELRAWAESRHDRDGRRDDRPRSEPRHERGSVPLAVPGRYAERFDRLRASLRAEMAAVADETMQREVELLETLWRQAREPLTR